MIVACDNLPIICCPRSDEKWHCDQARNQGGVAHPRKIYTPLEKCVGHCSKLLDTVQKIWAHLRKFFATSPGVPSWLRA